MTEKELVPMTIAGAMVTTMCCVPASVWPTRTHAAATVDVPIQANQKPRTGFGC